MQYFNMTLMSPEALHHRLRGHVARRTTDLRTESWQEPVNNYLDEMRFSAEQQFLRGAPTPFCPSAALAEAGAALPRSSVGIPLVAVRGADGQVSTFKNVCRHRGASVIRQPACAKALVCGYHGWTYRLDGSLAGIPSAEGFPEVAPDGFGLVPVRSTERYGMVFVNQGGAAKPHTTIEAIDGLITTDHRLVSHTDNVISANWKLVVETFLEGYHIRALHHSTFFPLQYDNINVVENFGPNSRISFPYRSIEKSTQPDVTPHALAGQATLVHHLFPNVMIATFPTKILMIVIEPTTIDTTTLHTFALERPDQTTTDLTTSRTESAGALVDAGAAEDFEIAESIQVGLTSGSNNSHHFGRFEGAITHFHRELTTRLAAMADPSEPQP